MPRESRSSHSSFIPTKPTTYAPPPKIWHQSEPFQTQSKTTLGQTIKEGVGFGIGSSVGHSIARTFGFGPMVEVHTPQNQNQAPYYCSPEYEQCVRLNKDKPEVCRPYLTKDKSPWKECMEMNGFNVNTCSESK